MGCGASKTRKSSALDAPVKSFDRPVTVDSDNFICSNYNNGNTQAQQQQPPPKADQENSCVPLAIVLKAPSNTSDNSGNYQATSVVSDSAPHINILASSQEQNSQQQLEEDDDSSVEPMPVFNMSRDAHSKHSKFLITDYNISGLSDESSASSASTCKQPVSAPRKSQRVLLDHPLIDENEDSDKSLSVKTKPIGRPSSRVLLEQPLKEHHETLSVTKNQPIGRPSSRLLLTQPLPEDDDDDDEEEEEEVNNGGCLVPAKLCQGKKDTHSRQSMFLATDCPKVANPDEAAASEPHPVALLKDKDTHSRQSLFLQTDHTPVPVEDEPDPTAPMSIGTKPKDGHSRQSLFLNTDCRPIVTEDTAPNAHNSATEVVSDSHQ